MRRAEAGLPAQVQELYVLCLHVSCELVSCEVVRGRAISHASYKHVTALRHAKLWSVNECARLFQAADSRASCICAA